MRVPRRLTAVATVMVMSACAGNWISDLNRAVPCNRSRAAVNQRVGPDGGRIDAEYAWVEFGPDAFSDSTTVLIHPHPRLHGIQVTLPDEDAMPAFDVGFAVDYCGDRPDTDDYFVVTERGPRPAVVENGIARARIEAGELRSRMREAGVMSSGMPLVSGFVILSN